MARDYYQTLGVAKDASDEAIKKAYKKCVLLLSVLPSGSRRSVGGHGRAYELAASLVEEGEPRGCGPTPTRPRRLATLRWRLQGLQAGRTTRLEWPARVHTYTAQREHRS